MNQKGIIQLFLIMVMFFFIFQLGFAFQMSITPGSSVSLDFEADPCFELGYVSKGYVSYIDNFAVRHIDRNASILPRGGYCPHEYQNIYGSNGYYFHPETNMVHSGTRSVKMGVINPQSSQVTRELEVLIDLDPLTNTEIWAEGWYYIPSSTKDATSAYNQWMVFHRLIVERLFDNTKQMSVQVLNLNLGILTDDRFGKEGQRMFSMSLNKATIDNNNDGGNDVLGKVDLYSNGGSYPPGGPEPITSMLVPFDQWFHVKTYVFRNIQNFNDGKVKVWINDVLLWDIEHTRTVGLDPTIISKYPPFNPSDSPDSYGYTTPAYAYGHVSTGFGCYTGVSSGTAVTVYLDDYALTVNGESPPDQNGSDEPSSSPDHIEQTGEDAISENPLDSPDILNFSGILLSVVTFIVVAKWWKNK